MTSARCRNSSRPNMPTCCSFPRRFPKHIRTRCPSRSRRARRSSRRRSVRSPSGLRVMRVCDCCRGMRRQHSGTMRCSTPLRSVGRLQLSMRKGRLPRSRATAPQRYATLYAAPLPATKPAATARNRGGGTRFRAISTRRPSPQRHRCRCVSSTLPARCADTPNRATSSAAVSRSPIASMTRSKRCAVTCKGDPRRVAIDLIEAQRDLATLRTSTRRTEAELAAARSAYA